MAACAGGCAPSPWQQRTGSAFLGALNSGAETFSGISYTVVWSADDEVVTPIAGTPVGDPCTAPYLPGLTPASVATHEAAVLAQAGTELTTYPHVSSEPPLPAYAYR